MATKFCFCMLSKLLFKFVHLSVLRFLVFRRKRNHHFYLLKTCSSYFSSKCIELAGIFYSFSCSLSSFGARKAMTPLLNYCTNFALVLVYFFCHSFQCFVTNIVRIFAYFLHCFFNRRSLTTNQCIQASDLL